MNREHYEEKRRLLGHAQPQGEQPPEHQEVGKTFQEGDRLGTVKFIADARKHLSSRS
jgi:hypothetical protein